MISSSDHTLITEQEAAALLQPFMGSKPAGQWLQLDRRSNPSISFFRSFDQIYYREADVIAFIRQVLAPDAKFIRIQDHLSPERRRVSDRRRLTDRRKHPKSTLHASLERRRPGQPERRQNILGNRRQQADLRQTA